jgi:predicted dehydrogenase
MNIQNTDVSSIKDLKNFVFGDLLKIEHIKMDNEEPLKKELESFVESVRNCQEPIVPGEEGIKAIKTATIIGEEIRRNLKLSNLNRSEGKL